jgi:predicted amidohydrolase YtcJ
MANNAADLVFRNGLIVTPDGTIEGGVAILDGRIAAVGSDGFYRLRIAKSISPASIFFLVQSTPNAI